MTRLLILALLLVFKPSFGQVKNNQPCKVEIYLLKSVRPNLDTTLKISGSFVATNTDLTDTSFIKDYEILGYSVQRDTVKFNDSTFINNRQILEVTAVVTDRINNLSIPLCCGKQFVLTVDGSIVYRGYFWNQFSSWGCEAITAFAKDSKITIIQKLPEYNTGIAPESPNQNEILLNCLIKTDRFLK